MTADARGMVLGSGLAPAFEAVTGALPGLRERSLDVASLVDLVGDCQVAMNQLAAVQSVALAGVAATDTERAEDGTLVERQLGFGNIRLDASSLVNGRLGVSDQRASTKVETAVGLVTRMPALLGAMNTGDLDDYRAQIAVLETADADPVVAARVGERVVTQLGGKLSSVSAGPFRRCVRATLDALDADAVRVKADRARDGRYLRRWPAEPGVEGWSAVLPSEDAVFAWAAVDDLARTYKAEGLVETLEQARADALVDLLLSRASVKVAVNLAVPVGTMTVTEAEGYVPVTGLTSTSNGPTFVAASWLWDLINNGVRPMTGKPEEAGGDLEPAARFGRLGRSLVPVVTIIECDPVTGIQLTCPTRLGAKVVNLPPSTTAYRIPQGLARFVDTRDGGCRFPGCTAAARVCDQDHVIPWPRGGTAADQIVALCRRHHRVKQAPGWNLALGADGTAFWTTPTGETRATTGADHLNTEATGPTPATSGDREPPATANAQQPEPGRHAEPEQSPETEPGADAQRRPPLEGRAEAEQRYTAWRNGGNRAVGDLETSWHQALREHARAMNTRPRTPDQKARDRRNGHRHGIVTDRYGLPVQRGPRIDLVYRDAIRAKTTIEPDEPDDEPPPF